MFISIKFDDKDEIFTKQCKDEGEVIAEKKKWEKDYRVRQVFTTRSGPGFIFLAEKRKERKKYIWE